MKKIFLTSGIVVCMACPAFATGFDFNATGQQSGACVDDYLGVTGGDTTLTAQWTAAYTEITLDVNSANGAATSTSVNPATIYGIRNDSTNVYTRAGTNDTNYVFTAVTNNTLTSTPAGKSVTLTVNGNKPSTAANDNNVSGLSAGAPANTNRAFRGFYSAATDGTQYINNSGTVISDGLTDAASASPTTTWYAQYDCVTYEPANPTLEGYTFDGWYDAASGGNEVTNFCIDDDTTIYAHWTRNNISITWQDNGATTAHVGGTSNCDYGADVTLPTAPSRTGYTFNGWAVNNSSSGDGNQPAGGSGMQTPGDLGGSGDGRNG